MEALMDVRARVIAIQELLEEDNEEEEEDEP